LRFFSFLRLQIRLLIFRWRWLLPLPIMGFIGYLLSNALKINLVPGILSTSTPRVNSWDALFIGFGNAYYVVFVIANLFLILVCDSLPETEFGQLAIFRLASRKKWWLAKSFSMFTAAFIYSLISMLTVLIVASIGLSTSLHWSPWTAGYPLNALLPFYIPGQMSPLAAALILFGMDVLGFWTLGTLMQVITLFTHRFLYGYLAALAILIGSIGLSSSLVNVPEVMKLIPVMNNLTMTFYPFQVRELPLIWSFAYWGFWLAVLFMAGWLIGRRQNYMARQP
jgi:hypothetical protein